jgi:3-deoxy-D-manno-octulosonic-acid transferase
MINGRISDRSWPRYRRWRALFRPFLRDMRAVAVRYESDADRFLELGVSREVLRVTGNTKHDRLVASSPAALPWPAGPVWTVGSIHPGEEVPVLNAYRSLRTDVPSLRLVLAPRHERAHDYFPEAVTAAGFRCARRSRPLPSDAEAEVLVLDTHGELDAVYAASAVAMVGGTMIPVGGHNPLEASAAGVPVLMGPYHANVTEDLDRLREAGGARVVTGDAELLEALRGWLLHPETRQEASVASRALVRELQGAAGRTLDWLVEREALPAASRGDA